MKSPNLRFQARLISTVLAVFLGLAAGCTNPYHENYLSTLDKRNKEELSRILPPSGPPRLVTSGDLKADSLKMRENGYLLVGRAKFRSTMIDETQALDQARKSGAEVVLVNHKYVNSAAESVPIEQWIPGKEIDHNETTVVQDGSATPTVIQKQSSTTVQGEFQTAYVEENMDYYDYAATFWAKAKPSLFGVLVKELDEKTKAMIGSNKGVLVRAVIKGSPAFMADILRDDVILSLGNDMVVDPDQFFDLMMRHQGEEVAVGLYRAGNNMTLNVTIGKE